MLTILVGLCVASTSAIEYDAGVSDYYDRIPDGGDEGGDGGDGDWGDFGDWDDDAWGEEGGYYYSDSVGGYYGNSTTFCATDCPDNWIKDGMCDKSCNVEECKMDGGDCEGKTPGDSDYYFGGQNFNASDGAGAFSWDDFFDGALGGAYQRLAIFFAYTHTTPFVPEAPY
jgi:hypothetical protein